MSSSSSSSSAAVENKGPENKKRKSADRPAAQPTTKRLRSDSSDSKDTKQPSDETTPDVAGSNGGTPLTVLINQGWYGIYEGGENRGFAYPFMVLTHLAQDEKATTCWHYVGKRYSRGRILACQWMPDTDRYRPNPYSTDDDAKSQLKTTDGIPDQYFVRYALSKCKLTLGRTWSSEAKVPRAALSALTDLENNKQAEAQGYWLPTKEQRELLNSCLEVAQRLVSGRDGDTTVCDIRPHIDLEKRQMTAECAEKETKV
jgi:hypothetical protein